MKFLDYKCPNCGGEVEVKPGGKKGVCLNCGVELEIETEVTNRINRAFDLISQKKYVKAQTILDYILQIDSKNGEAYLGQLLCELEICSPAFLTQAKTDYSNSPNYIRACQFLDGQKKTELEKACKENECNLVQKEKAPAISPLIEQFRENDLFVGDDGTKFSITGYWAELGRALQDNSLDYLAKHFENIRNFLFNTRKQMESIILLNDKISNEKGFDEKAYDEYLVKYAIKVYSLVKETIEREENEQRVNNENGSCGSNDGLAQDGSGEESENKIQAQVVNEDFDDSGDEFEVDSNVNVCSEDDGCEDDGCEDDGCEDDSNVTVTYDGGDSDDDCDGNSNVGVSGEDGENVFNTTNSDKMINGVNMNLFEELKKEVSTWPSIPELVGFVREDISNVGLMDLVEKAGNYLDKFDKYPTLANFWRLRDALVEINARSSTVPLTKRGGFNFMQTCYVQWIICLAGGVYNRMGPQSPKIILSQISSGLSCIAYSLQN